MEPEQLQTTTDNSKNAPENNGSTESTGGQAKQNTDTGFPEGSEPYQQYLSRTNDPDPTNIQYNMDFERFLRDHGATEIVYGGDFDGGVNAYVSYKNNIIVKLEFHERIPYTMHYAWSGGVIFANSRGPFTTMGDGYGESDWGKTYSMDRRPYDTMTISRSALMTLSIPHGKKVLARRPASIDRRCLWRDASTRTT